MIVYRGCCSFCGRSAANNRGGFYQRPESRRADLAESRICRRCLIVAFREFGEPAPGLAEVVVLHRLAQTPEDGDAA